MMIPIRTALSIWIGALLLGLMIWVPGWINRSGTAQFAESRLRNVEAYQEAVGTYQQRWRDRTQEIRSQLPPPREILPGVMSPGDWLDRKRTGERAKAELGPMPAPPNWVADALGKVEDTQLEVRLTELTYELRRVDLLRLQEQEAWKRYGAYAAYAWGVAGSFLGIVFRRHIPG